MCANKVDKPARLIRLSFVSDSLSRKKQILRRQRCLQQGRVGITLNRAGTEKNGIFCFRVLALYEGEEIDHIVQYPLTPNVK